MRPVDYFVIVSFIVVLSYSLWLGYRVSVLSGVIESLCKSSALHSLAIMVLNGATEKDLEEASKLLGKIGE